MAKKFPDLNKDGETTYADVLIGRGVRLEKQEGGSIDDQMMMVMTMKPMESDEKMEDNYKLF